ncbi:hypothetical protein [Nocardioides pakistanensis]
MPISRLALATATMQRLTDTVGHATGYYGEIGQGLPGTTVPAKPPADPDGRVHPYYVLYPSPGTPGAEQDLGDSHEDLDWLIQVTAAAGHLHDLVALIDRIDAALYRWRPVVDGAVAGPLKPPPGFDPGPARRDDDTVPPRHYLPLQYRLSATPA